MSGFYIGMDVGGTNLRLKIADESGKVLGEYGGQGCSLNIAGYDALLLSYHSVIQQALHDHGFQISDCRGMCLAATGVDEEPLRERYIQVFETLGFDRRRLLVFNDCEVFLHATENACIAAVAGTGSIVFGKSKDGGVYRCGGWGHLLSDEGSGFYLVKRAAEEIIHEMDSSDRTSLLSKLFQNASGLTTQHEISIYFFQNIKQKSEIAKFAPLVTQAAEQGDEIAKRILQEAAEKLWRNIEPVAKQAIRDSCDEFTVLLWGSVYEHVSMIFSAVEEKVKAKYPNAYVQRPSKSALDTALEIAYHVGN